MAELDGWPSISNDSGDGKTGTPVDKDWADDVKEEIEDKIHSATNPTETPASTTNEVVAARGNEASLDARISGVIDDDGALVTQASLVSVAQLQEIIGFSNIVPFNADMRMWGDGDSSAPNGYTLSGAGAAIARVGDGLGDTWKAYGPFGTKVTYGSATAELVMTILDAAAMQEFLKGESVGIGATLKSGVANHARLFVDDGVSKQYGDYHAGDNADEWVSSAFDISGAATKLEIGLSVEQAGAAYIDGLTMGIGNRAPSRFIPPKSGIITIPIKLGTPSTGDGQDYIRLPYPWIIRNVYALATTAPSGGVVTIDIERSASAGWASIFSSEPDILADGDNTGLAQPDGTYANRCVAGVLTDLSDDLSNTDNGVVRINLDAVNSVGGLTIFIEAFAWMPELNAFMAYDDFAI